MRNSKIQLSNRVWTLYSTLGKDAIKEKKVGGMQTTITELETYTSYYIRIAAFTKEHQTALIQYSILHTHTYILNYYSYYHYIHYWIRGFA